MCAVATKAGRQERAHGIHECRVVNGVLVKGISVDVVQQLRPAFGIWRGHIGRRAIAFTTAADKFHCVSVDFLHHETPVILAIETGKCVEIAKVGRGGENRKKVSFTGKRIKI